MTEVTQILTVVERGDANAAGGLLPLLCDELRNLARRRLGRESPIVQSPTLAYEPTNRLFSVDKAVHWNGRGHFYAAAAEAMRRILVENARHNVGLQRRGLRGEQTSCSSGQAQEFAEELVALDEALSLLGENDSMAEQLAQLRYFAGLTSPEAADAMGISAEIADRTWGHAQAWLLKQLHA